MSDESQKKDQGIKTLTDGDIVSTSRVGRRAAVAKLGAAVVGVAAVAVSLQPGTASAVTDSDSGPNADRAGNGRGGR